ncbi:MAG: type I DNA topoisomerase [Candidatus Tectomicrobia bacterium]|uniref:DNA topoisomerase 1 n=1 Tax=Tectimicrobiota bacterium TaxID=2528274 RepID=A0A932I012_UNCTE|nr:type I DNA topoisomerase [Candidatus Tectomicrobia bacterium]
MIEKNSKARPRAKKAKKAQPKSRRARTAGSTGGGSSATKLLIVESPAKVKTIQKMLGPEFAIMASKGHVRDLKKTGERKMGIDVRNDFSADYGEIPAKKKAIDELRRAAKAAGEIYLAPDPDREGEAIAWHVKEIIGNGRKEDSIYRVSFNEITPRAVREALERPGRIDQKKVDAQETRRKLDRIVGFKLSGEILWNKVAFGLSAGRVQSVALRLICEREDEIEAFQPKEYWTITAFLQKEGTPPPFEAKIHRVGDREPEIGTEAEARSLAERIARADLRVSKVERRERRRRPPAPFITSTLQQESSNKLRYGAKRTMSIAQSLYEGVDLGRELGTVGLITYMRTDSVRLAPEAVNAAREYIQKNFSAGHLPEKPPVYKTGEMAQDAHEAIRPTDPSLHPDRVASRLKPEQLALYTLIWRRFLAGQMAPAVYDQTSVDITAEDLLLRATGSVLKFPGFLDVYQERTEEAEGPPDSEEENGRAGAGGRDRLLPSLDEGDPVRLRGTEAASNGVLPEQHFTQPPPRYTEAALVKELEEDGVGRPSTYATILDTLEKRKYVTVERRKRQFTPTSLGREVNKLLVRGFPDVMDVKFTAKMESDLDDIEKGSTPWLPILRTFYDRFDRTVQTAKKALPNLKTHTEPVDRACPECGEPLVKKFSKNGWFISCSAYPDCKFSESLPEEGSPEEDEDLVQGEEKAPPCEECGASMQARRGPFGPYLVCSEYPKEHKTRKILPGGKAAAAPIPTGVPCGREGCGGELVMRRSRKSGKPFYGCNKFPECKYVVWDRPVARPCPACGHPISTIKVTKKSGVRLVCPIKSCGHSEPAPPGLLASLGDDHTESEKEQEVSA